jgi:ankyrin repeat protein
MKARLIVTLTQQEYTDLLANPDPSVAAAQNDALFEFDAVGFRIKIKGEFRELGTSPERRNFRKLLSNDLLEPEKAIERFGTKSYKRLTKQRRDRARAALANVAPPGGAVIGRPAGLTGQMDAAQAGQHMLANGGGFVMGYEHKDQNTKDFATEMIQKCGGPNLRHVFVEEFSSELQNDITAFLADPAAVMPPALQNRISELQTGKNVDFEPMLYAAREKGVKVWGIDTPKADPQVDTSDPRYHERRLVLMNAEAKRVFDKVRRNHPGEPFMAMTGGDHVNTAEGGVPGLAQIMGVPGVSLNPGAKKLAFLPEDPSRRAALAPLERECAEAIVKKAGADYKQFVINYKTTPAYTGLPDPKPSANDKLNFYEITAVSQAIVAQFVANGQLNAAGDIAGLLSDPAAATAIQRVFRATVLRNDRHAKVLKAVKEGDIVKVQGALDEDPYLVKVVVDEVKEDTFLHAACEAGHPAVVRELIQRGSNPNAVDLTGYTPLHKALAQVKDDTPQSPELGLTVRHLLTAGANVNVADPTGKTGMDRAKTNPGLMEEFAARNAAPVTELFTTKFVAEARKRYKAAAQQGREFDEQEVRQAAANLAGALPGNGVPLGTSRDVTAAMTNGAVTTELTRLTNLLVARPQQKLDAVDAIKTKNLAKLQGALNADPRLAHIPIDSDDHMALGLAAVEGDSNALDELINNRGVNINQKSPVGRTALLEVVSKEILKTDVAGQQQLTANAGLLTARGADINARNGRGETAMHIAGFRNNQSLITALKAVTSPPSPAVADLTARDNRGWTPMDTAMGGTNREAEDLLHPGPTGQAPPLKAGQLSSIDILHQATMCEDPADSHKVRKFLEQLYANPDLRPLLDLAAASACDNHKPPNGGMRFFASMTNTVGRLYARDVGATAAYDQKVNTLLFPLKDDPGDNKEGDAIGSLAHELTHMTAHLVTDDPQTLPFTNNAEKAQYLAAIDADVKKLHLLDDRDPVQKFIKNRFSGRMDTYENYAGTIIQKTPADFDESLLQEFIVGVPQVAAIYGMDALKDHIPGLVGYYQNVWTPKVQHTLANDVRFANGRAKIDTAANGRAAAALAGKRKPKTVNQVFVKLDDPELDIDTLIGKIEKDFIASKGQTKTGLGRSIVYKLDDVELSLPDQNEFANKKSAIRSALKTALAGDNFPRQIDLNEIRTLVESLSGAVQAYSGDQLKTALNNRSLNWVKDAKSAFVARRIKGTLDVSPKDMAEAIAYRAEAEARAGAVGADLDPDTEIKVSKQKDLIKGLTKSLEKGANAKKLTDQPQRILDEVSATLANPTAQAVYMKAGATTHVSVDVKEAKNAWVLKLAAIN